MEAFVAGNEARVASMASAKTNIERMLEGLEACERQVRQDQITAEVVELAATSGLLESEPGLNIASTPNGRHVKWWLEPDRHPLVRSLRCL
jgi:hypothetical protein